MTVYEYGSLSSPVVIFLHGGGLSWWNYRKEAELLKEDFHVVIPVLDGHAGSGRAFTSIADNAAELIGFIDERFGSSVKAICALSLGAQILVEMLSQRGDMCEYAVIESALVVPMPMTNKLIDSSVSMSYGLIKKPWFARLQFKSLGMDESFYDDYYRDSCLVSEEDMKAFLKANTSFSLDSRIKAASAKTLILAGSKEPPQMLRSAALLHEAVDGSELRILNGYSHGELSLNHAEEYVSLLRNFIKQQR